jgi:DNA polymerase-3 subunit delta'
MNWGMIGHQWAVKLLQGHLAQGQARHAYLFTGPQGVGRRTLALRYAQALNCTQPPGPGQFCQTCRECLQIARMQHPDLHVIQAEGHSGTLKVDQIRELQRSLYLAPYQARYRVVLLLRFEQANLNAANAMLKTLEEPPPQVVLLLTAESAESLLPTIVSRCEVVRLRPQPAEVVGEGLKGIQQLDETEARLLAQVSQGRPGYALHLAGQPELLEQRDSALDDLMGLLAAGRVARFAYAESLAKDRQDLARVLRVLQTWLSLWRDVLFRVAGSDALITNPDRASDIGTIAGQTDLATARRTVSALNRTLDHLRGNINRRLALEVLMLDLPDINP